MRLRCQTKKDSFNNLTVGTEYEAIEEGDIYIVTNNAGLRSRYAKRYFTVVPQAPIARTIAEALTVVITNNFSTVGVSVSIGERNLFSYNLSVLRSQNSCGVDEIQGINGLKANITEVMGDGRRFNRTLITGTPTDMFRLIMTAVITYVKQHHLCAFYTLSDVVDEAFDEVITEMACYHTIGNNPNSGNDINFWLITRAE